MISGPRFMSRLNQEKQIRTTQKKIFRFKLLQLGKSSVKMFHFSQNFYFVLTKAKLEFFRLLQKALFKINNFGEIDRKSCSVEQNRLKELVVEVLRK